MAHRWCLKCYSTTAGSRVSQPLFPSNILGVSAWPRTYGLKTHLKDQKTPLMWFDITLPYCTKPMILPREYQLAWYKCMTSTFVTQPRPSALSSSLPKEIPWWGQSCQRPRWGGHPTTQPARRNRYVALRVIKRLLSEEGSELYVYRSFSPRILSLCCPAKSSFQALLPVTLVKARPFIHLRLGIHQELARHTKLTGFPIQMWRPITHVQLSLCIRSRIREAWSVSTWG